MSTELARRKRGKELIGVIRETLTWGKNHRQEQEWRFAVFARAVAEYCQDRHWEDDQCKSASDWMQSIAQEFDLRPSSMWNAYRVGARLAPHLSESLMKEIGKSNLYLLAQSVGDSGVPPDPGLVEKARTMKFGDFKHETRPALLEGEPENSHDLRRVDDFWVSRQEEGFIEEVVELGRRVGIGSRHRCLVASFDLANREWSEKPEVEGA